MTTDARPSWLRLTLDRYLHGKLSPPTGQADDNERPWRKPLAGALFAGCVLILIYSSVGSNKVATAAGCLIVAGAAFFVGVLAGFVFGIPRTLQLDTARSASEPDPRGTYGANTNLEQISDWLTKILVGAGLVQLGALQGRLAEIGDTTAAAMGSAAAGNSVVAQCIVLYFGICGFLLGYLWTRIYLTSEFSQLDRAFQETPDFYEGLMNAYLYQAPPLGYQRVLAAFEKYRRKFGEPRNARIWVYLASAYAQRFEWESKAKTPDPTVMDEARSAALEAVGRAILVDPSSVAWVLSLWDPHRATPPDNDLVVFFEDERFKKLLEQAVKDAQKVNQLGGASSPQNPSGQPPVVERAGPSTS